MRRDPGNMIRRETMAFTPRKPITSIHAVTILDSIADGVFTVDGSMHITYFNGAAERITGVTREDAIGQYCFEVFRANICEKTCALICTFSTGQEIIDKPVNILRADSKQIPVSISTAVLRDSAGKIVGGVESFRDLSPIEELRKEITRKYTFEDIVSKNHRVLSLFDILPHLAETETTVLIQGPSGSGKELFARAIHNVRGGIVATILDSAMVRLLHDLFGGNPLTGRLDIRYFAPTPLHTTLTVTARVIDRHGKTFRAEAEILQDAARCASARGVSKLI